MIFTNNNQPFVGGLINLTPAGEELLAKVKTKSLKVARKRFCFLFPEEAPTANEEGCKHLAASLKAKWMGRYKEGVELYGDGVLGLLPLFFKRGNRLPKSTAPKSVPIPRKKTAKPKKVKAASGARAKGREENELDGADEVRTLATGWRRRKTWNNEPDSLRTCATAAPASAANIRTSDTSPTRLPWWSWSAAFHIRRQ